jgi:hypothetical protein
MMRPQQRETISDSESVLPALPLATFGFLPCGNFVSLRDGVGIAGASL